MISQRPAERRISFIWGDGTVYTEKVYSVDPDGDYDADSDLYKSYTHDPNSILLFIGLRHGEIKRITLGEWDENVVPYAADLVDESME